MKATKHGNDRRLAAYGRELVSRESRSSFGEASWAIDQQQSRYNALVARYMERLLKMMK